MAKKYKPKEKKDCHHLHNYAGCSQNSEKKANDDMGQRLTQTTHLLHQDTHHAAAGFSGWKEHKSQLCSSKMFTYYNIQCNYC